VVEGVTVHKHLIHAVIEPGERWSRTASSASPTASRSRNSGCPRPAWGYPYLLHTTQKIDVSLPVGTAIVMLGVAVLFSALVSATQLAVSIHARSPREAQQYVTPLYFVTVLPALAVQFVSDWQRSAWAYLVPVLNAFFAFREPLLGTVNWGHLFLAAVSCAFYAALALEIAIWLMSRESVIFRV